MAYFERKGVLLSFSQLKSQVQSHYIHQALQQAYVLILGLDVLGNPYGLIKDFTQGLGDFFYEPFLVSSYSNTQENYYRLKDFQKQLVNTVNTFVKYGYCTRL